MTESINHPQHYGGDTPYEAIKVIEAWQLGFCLGNTVKYISRAGKKAEDPSGRLGHADQEKLRKEKLVEDLEKARWYLDREIQALKGKPRVFRSQMSPAVPVPCGKAWHVLGITDAVLDGLCAWDECLKGGHNYPVRLVTLEGLQFDGFIVNRFVGFIVNRFDEPNPMFKVNPLSTIELGQNNSGVCISRGTFSLGDLASISIISA